MATKKTSSATQKENYKRYATEMRWKKNKVRQLQRHMKKFPNDKAAEKAYAKVAEKDSPAGPTRPGNNVGTCRKHPLNMKVIHMTRTMGDQLRELGFFRRGRR